MFRSIAILALCLSTITAQAALLGRAALTPGGTDYQAYYDDVLNITWLADAQASAGSPFDNGVDASDGLMTWAAAHAWIGSLNSSSYLGQINWRLPTVEDIGTPGCVSNFYGPECGWNVSTGEMANLFYSTLGNAGYYNTSGQRTGCSTSPPYCLANDGPFSNVQVYYWYGTAYQPSTFSDLAWVFGFGNGWQFYDYRTSYANAWAVIPGDIGLVPVPPAVWLFSSALGVMGWMRRKSPT